MVFLNTKLPYGRNRQRGVGMIEVLIAVTISAFALLGLAGLQVASLRYQKVANFRSLASQYGADMTDRIRANASAVTASSATNRANYQTTDQYSTSPPSTVPACAGNPPAACASPQAVADKDIYQWRLALNNAMAGGWGTVSAYDAVARTVTVTVYFNEPDKALAGAADPNCNAAVFSSGVDQKAIRCFTTTVTP